MADLTIYPVDGTDGDEYGSLTTSWANLPSGTFTNSGATADFGTYSVAGNTWTAPASGLPDGVLVLMQLEGEDSSNGRTAFALRATNSSGTGTVVSGQGGGFSRDNSEDRAYAKSWAVIHNPGASSVWNIQGRRSTDAPNTADEFVTGSVQFIPLYYNAIGLYDSQSTQTLTGTTPTRITGWTAQAESDTTAIELGATTTDVIDCKTNGARYLVLGSGYMDNSASTRTQREFHIRQGGTPGAMGVTYLRQASAGPNGTAIYDMFEGGASAIALDMAGYRGRGVAARQGGADVDGGISTAENEFALAVIELNSGAEVWRSHSTTQQECALTGPVDIQVADVIDFNDAAAYASSSATAFTVSSAHDMLVLSNIACPRNTSSIGSGSRWTAYSEITLNGTEQTNQTRDGDYNRGSQGGADTQGWSSHAGGVLTVSANDEIGVSVTELAGSEGGGGDIETEPFANNEGVTFIALNVDSLQAASGTDALTAEDLESTSEVGAPALLMQPNVWLNSASTTSGADSMTVTAFSGSEITFSDPAGGQTGSLVLGVENTGTGEFDWIAVTVSSGSTDNLTAEDVESASEVTSPAIGQEHALDATDVESASEVTAATLGQEHALDATDVESASEVGTPALAEVHVLDATDVESASEVGTPAIAQEHGLDATDVESASEVTSPAIGQEHALLAEDVESASEVTSPNLAEAVTALLAEDVESASEVTSPNFAQVHGLDATDVESASEVTSAALGQEHALLGDDVESASEVGTPAFTTIHGLDATDVESASEVDTPAIGQTHALDATDVESASEVGTPSLSLEGQIAGTGALDGYISTISGVGEREITSTSDLDGYIPTVSGVGIREIVGTGAVNATSPTIENTVPEPPGTFIVYAPIQVVMNDSAIAKSVNVQGL